MDVKESAKIKASIISLIDGERRLVTYLDVCRLSSTTSTEAKRLLREILSEDGGEKYRGVWTMFLRKGGVVRVVLGGGGEEDKVRWRGEGWSIGSCCCYGVGEREVVGGIGEVGVWGRGMTGWDVGGMVKAVGGGRVERKRGGIMEVEVVDKVDKGEVSEVVEKKKGLGLGVGRGGGVGRKKKGVLGKFVNGDGKKKQSRGKDGNSGTEDVEMEECDAGSSGKDGEVKDQVEKKGERKGHGLSLSAGRKSKSPNSTSKQTSSSAPKKAKGGISMRSSTKKKLQKATPKKKTPSPKPQKVARRKAVVIDSEDEDEDDQEIKAMEEEEREREEREKEARKWNPLHDDEEPEAEMTDEDDEKSDIEMEDAEVQDTPEKSVEPESQNGNKTKKRGSKRLADEMEIEENLEPGQQRIDAQLARPKRKKFRKLVDEQVMDDEGFFVTKQVWKIFNEQGNEIVQEDASTGEAEKDLNSSSSEEKLTQETSAKEKERRKRPSKTVKRNVSQGSDDSAETPEAPKKKPGRKKQSSQKSSQKKKGRPISSYFGKKS